MPQEKVGQVQKVRQRIGILRAGVLREATVLTAAVNRDQNAKDLEPPSLDRQCNSPPDSWSKEHGC